MALACARKRIVSQTNMERALAAVKEMVKTQGIGNSLNGHDPVGEPEGIVDHPGDLHALSASTHILVKDMADALTRAMPGFRWAIQPSEFGKVFNVFCLDFSARWGYRIKYVDVMNDPRRKEAVRAGRTILARFRYPGVRYTAALMAAIRRNASGEAIPDVSGMAQTRFTKRVNIEQALSDGTARVVGTKGSGQIIEVRQGNRSHD
jgi:hypothetical protein